MSNRVPLLALIAVSSIVSACAATSDDPSTRSSLSVVDCHGAKPWAEWVAYGKGNLVTEGDTTYECIQPHTSLPGWNPKAVPALWSPVTCSGSSGGGGSTGGGGGSTGGGGGGGSTGGGSSTCDPAKWVYMGSDANACTGHVGESCGWTSTNLGQGYHCTVVSWGVGCSPGGTTCPGGGTSGGGGSSGGGGGSSGGGSSGGGGGTGGGGSTGGGGGSIGGSTPAGFVFSPYKDTGINMDWTTNVASTTLSGSRTSVAKDLASQGGKAITLAFGTGECGSENWGGVPGDAMGKANVPLLDGAGVKFILATGGAAGSFSCGSDAGFETFLSRWASTGLIGVDFDIEAGQSEATINALVQRVSAAHAKHPGLRFSFTIATLANNSGGSTAKSLGSGFDDSLNVYGDNTLKALKAVFGGSWPSYLVVNLMTMDYGAPSAGVCVVSGGRCQMGQSAIQAAYNLHDHWGVPFANIELTPMIGGNDATDEIFTLADADAIATFVKANGLAGIHYWSYDRDNDCPAGYASPTCNSMGGAGTYGFLKRFAADGIK